jgi:hypothetical protein
MRIMITISIAFFACELDAGAECVVCMDKGHNLSFSSMQ